jgi:hypothetical protein
MTKDEARAKAIAAGIPAAALNDAIIEQFGYEPQDPQQDLVAGPVIPSDEEAADLKALAAEAKSNALPANIAKGVTTALKLLAKAGIALLLLLSLMTFNGCSSAQAVHSTQQMERCVKALNEQHLAMEENDIVYYRKSEAHKIDELYQKSVAASMTKDGLIDAKLVEVLMQQKQESLARSEEIIAKKRAKQALIAANAASAIQYGDALQAYFADQAVSFESLKTAQDQLIDMLNAIVKKPANGGTGAK